MDEFGYDSDDGDFAMEMAPVAVVERDAGVDEGLMLPDRAHLCSRSMLVRVWRARP